MAITESRVVLTAQEARNIAAQMYALHTRVTAFTAYNSSQSIDWATLDSEDEGVNASGLVEGEDFTPAEVSNAIGTFAQFLTAMGSGHLGNLHKLASPQ